MAILARIWLGFGYGGWVTGTVAGLEGGVVGFGLFDRFGLAGLTPRRPQAWCGDRTRRGT